MASKEKVNDAQNDLVYKKQHLKIQHTYIIFSIGTTTNERRLLNLIAIRHEPIESMQSLINCLRGGLSAEHYFAAEYFIIVTTDGSNINRCMLPNCCSPCESLYTQKLLHLAQSACSV